MRPLRYSLFSWARRSPEKVVQGYTLHEALNRYLAEVSPTKRSGYQEQSIAKVWLNTPLTDMRLSKVRPMHVVQLRDEWLKDKAPATVTRRLALLSHLFSIACKEWGHEKLRNPVLLIRKPKVKNARERRLLTGLDIPGWPVTEFDWLILHSRNPQFRSLMVVAVETAMRRSEIVGLRWENIDFVGRTAFLPMTKNGHARTVPLSPAALTELERMRPEVPEGLVFRISAGAFTRAFIRSRRRCRTRYEALCRQHGIAPKAKYFRDLRVYDLRHEATSRLAPLYQVHELAKITGHSDTRMLMRYYHPDMSELAQRMDGR